jgi:hypothetical protein
LISLLLSTFLLFKHKRGLRQGDCLSSYLFIVAIDTLQYVFKWAIDAELISPLKDKIAQLRLSLYVDDVTIFINPIQSDVVIMMHFGEATGLRINVNKSSVAPIRCL